ncbi:MAG: hypothetical protein QXT45_06370 [Candidatus Bilamarchaeaceae archaeon]
MVNDFETIVEEAKRIKSKALKHTPYTGEIVIDTKMDLHPADYVELEYTDLLNLYERHEKIIKASEMLAKRIGVQPPPARVVTPAAPLEIAKKIETKEVEERLKQITQEAIAEAEKLKAAAPPPEVKEEKVKEEERLLEIEIEREKPAEKIEVVGERKPAPPELEIEKPAEIEKEIMPEEKAVPEKPPSEEKERPVVEEARMAMPSILESPDKAAEDKYRQIEKEVLDTIGEKADDATIKKKMLELTKELFKEKSTSAREKIKLQITVLKNILASRKSGAVREAAAAAKGKAKVETIAHAQLLETLTSTQKIELAQSKDSIINNYRAQINPIRAKFTKTFSEARTADEKKEAYDAMVFSITSLSEQIPSVVAKYRDYLKKKHLAEIANIERNVSEKEKETLKRINKRKKEIAEYNAEFDVVGDILKKETDAIIRSAGREVFRKAEEEKTPIEIEEEKVDDVIAEIESTDEGTLLYYLHSHDPDYYKDYERKHRSKAEALARAKTLMAKEKGLNASTIKKYFGNAGG